jgi:hypothetical protein
MLAALAGTSVMVAHAASQGLDAIENRCARISMMARSANAPLEGRIQKCKIINLQIITSGLQRTAGPYRCVRSGLIHRSKRETRFVLLKVSLWLTGKHDVVPIAEHEHLRRTPNDTLEVYHGAHAQPKLPQQQVLNEVER